MVSEGYENTFTKDFDSDGLISGGSFYQLLGDDGAVTLKSSSSSSGLNDRSSHNWNVTAAKNNSKSFQVLFQGTRVLDCANYVWTTDSNGIYKSNTKWLSDERMVSEGYESIFNRDINNNGVIGS